MNFQLVIFQILLNGPMIEVLKILLGFIKENNSFTCYYPKMATYSQSLSEGAKLVIIQLNDTSVKRDQDQ